MFKFKNKIIGFFLLVIVFSCVACGNKETVLVGSYVRTVDINTEIKAVAASWLNDAGMSDEIDMSSYDSLPSLSINVAIYSDNSYVEELTADSYDNLRMDAYKLLEDNLAELIILRANAQGKEMDRSQLDSLILDKTGLSISDYITQYGPELIPDYEKMKLDYNKSGVMEAAGDNN